MVSSDEATMLADAPSTTYEKPFKTNIENNLSPMSANHIPPCLAQR